MNAVAEWNLLIHNLSTYIRPHLEQITSSQRRTQQVKCSPSRLIKKILNPLNRLGKFRNGSLGNLKGRHWTIQSKLQALFLGVSLGSVVVVSGIGWGGDNPPETLME